MPEITDIEKLAPELLKKSLAQLEREITERQMAMDRIQREAAIKEKEELAGQANSHIDAINEGVTFLHRHGVLPARITEAFSRGDGMFVPAMILRHITAEKLLPAQDKPRRRRRTKAEIEALKAAGEYRPRKRRAA